MRHALKSIPVIIAALALAIQGWLGTLPVDSAEARQLPDVVPINPDADWNRTQPHVAYDSGNHRYLFVWRDKRNDDPNNRKDQLCEYRRASPYCWPNADIYGHLVDGDGTVHPGPDIHIASDRVVEARDQQWPHVSFDPTRGEYLVAWQEVSPRAEEGGNSTNWLTNCYDIKAQRVGTDGSLLEGPITVSQAIDCQWVPVISYDLRFSKYLLTWHDNRYRDRMEPPREYGSDKEIFAQWLSYDDDGLVREVPRDLLITTDAGDASLPAPKYQQYSAIAYDPGKSEHYVLWSDDRLPDEMTVEPHYDIFFQRLSVGSSDPMTNTLLYQAPYVQEKPRASFNPLTGEIWAVWQSYEGFHPEAHDFAVQLVRFVPEDAPLSDVLTISAGLSTYPLPDVACSDLSGNCLAVWQDEGLAYQAFDRSGASLGTPARLAAFASTGHIYPRVIASDGGPGLQFAMTFSYDGRVYFALLEDEIPTLTPTATLTPTFTPTSTPSDTPTPTETQSLPTRPPPSPSRSATTVSERPTSVSATRRHYPTKLVVHPVASSGTTSAAISAGRVCWLRANRGSSGTKCMGRRLRTNTTQCMRTGSRLATGSIRPSCAAPVCWPTLARRPRHPRSTPAPQAPQRRLHPQARRRRRRPLQRRELLRASPSAIFRSLLGRRESRPHAYGAARIVCAGGDVRMVCTGNHGCLP